MRSTALLLVLVLGASACREDAPTATASAEPSMADLGDAAAEAGEAPLPPLEGGWIERVPLPDGGFAYVTPPVGARDARPVVVAVRGAVDDAGLMCSAWRLAVDVYAFVVCPAGRPVPGRPDAYVWSSSAMIAERAEAAIAAVAARWPAHVDAGAPALYAAFSQGAILAGPVLAKGARRFPRAVLTEGGARVFDDPSVARAFARGGGERVLFTCSQPGCSGTFAPARAAAERAGLAARVLDAGPHGHSMKPPVREALNRALPWIVDGLPGWEGYANAPKLATH